MKILFADDMESERMLVSRKLERRGHTVEVVIDGDEILDRLNVGRIPEVIVTDNNMLRMNGLEVLRLLRTDERFRVFKTMPVIVRSADWTKQQEVVDLGGLFVEKMSAHMDNLYAALDKTEGET